MYNIFLNFVKILYVSINIFLNFERYYTGQEDFLKLKLKKILYFFKKNSKIKFKKI